MSDKTDNVRYILKPKTAGETYTRQKMHFAINRFQLHAPHFPFLHFWWTS